MSTLTLPFRRLLGSQPLPLSLRIANQREYIRERLRGSPLPPTTMMHLVQGSHDASMYVEYGRRAAQSIRDTLEKSHLNITMMRRTLDFGCGCGRVLRHWKDLAKTNEFYGTDYNPELVFWCRKVIPFAQVDQNGLEPPLGYSDNYFDLIYALSTFTHWTVPLQKAWMREFTRVLKPGGLLLFSVHGDFYLPLLSPEYRERFLAGQPIAGDEFIGTNQCGAYAPFSYVQSELCQELSLHSFYPRSALGNPWQDIYLLQKP